MGVGNCALIVSVAPGAIAGGGPRERPQHGLLGDVEGPDLGLDVVGDPACDIPLRGVPDIQVPGRAAAVGRLRYRVGRGQPVRAVLEGEPPFLGFPQESRLGLLEVPQGLDCRGGVPPARHRPLAVVDRTVRGGEAGGVQHLRHRCAGLDVGVHRDRHPPLQAPGGQDSIGDELRRGHPDHDAGRGVYSLEESLPHSHLGARADLHRYPDPAARQNLAMEGATGIEGREAAVRVVEDEAATPGLAAAAHLGSEVPAHLPGGFESERRDVLVRIGEIAIPVPVDEVTVRRGDH